MLKNHKILIVDDEPDILELLQYNLKKEGFQIETASDGKEAIQKVKSFSPDLILLDIMMPVMDGIEVCRQIRKISKGKLIHIIFLTARSEEYSEIAAFEMGANDFISKPIKPRALISRIISVFKKEEDQIKIDEAVTVRDIHISKQSYTVLKNQEKIILPKKEFEILYFLCQNPDKVFSREDLLRRLWGDDVLVISRTIDVHIRKIREKIGENYINTVKGIGYKFDSEG